MKSLYTLNAVEKLIAEYTERGGTVHTIQEGCLGYGLTVLTSETLKTIVIKEEYLSAWSSVHSIRMYNKTPEKYQRLIDKLHA